MNKFSADIIVGTSYIDGDVHFVHEQHASLDFHSETETAVRMQTSRSTLYFLWLFVWFKLSSGRRLHWFVF